MAQQRYVPSIAVYICDSLKKTMALLHLVSIFLFVGASSGEWIEIQQTTGKKGEDEEVPGGCWKDRCAPDIHSWTSATWGNKSNKTRDELPPTGLPRTSEGNLMLLTSLENNLQQQIESKVFELGEREGRTMAKGMGSMESALVTISLLTFAVYLIKLIMKLIHSVHHHKKTTETTAMGMAVTVTPVAGLQTVVLSHHRKKRRSFSQEDEQLKMLELLDQYYKNNN